LPIVRPVTNDGFRTAADTGHFGAIRNPLARQWLSQRRRERDQRGPDRVAVADHCYIQCAGCQA
jgi:hypothetical protein